MLWDSRVDIEILFNKFLLFKLRVSKFPVLHDRNLQGEVWADCMVTRNKLGM